MALVAHAYNTSYLGSDREAGEAKWGGLQDTILMKKKLSMVTYTCHPSHRSEA
jgi:hypothetical protein